MTFRTHPKGKHTIGALRFTAGQDGMEAPIECDCGWSGLVREFRGHTGPDASVAVLGPRADNDYFHSAINGRRKR